MKNVLLFGASIVHGVGGSAGGWADKLKLSLHRDLYGEDAVGERCEVYELGVPGATTADLLVRFRSEAEARVGSEFSDDTCIVILTGTNDAKAVDRPDNFFTSVESFDKIIRQLLETARRYTSHVVVLGLLPVDERKVNPEYNPLTGIQAYFKNDRIKQFDEMIQKVSQAVDVVFVPLFEAVPENWVDRCLFTDGIHPNNDGHNWILRQVEPVVREKLGSLLDQVQ